MPPEVKNVLDEVLDHAEEASMYRNSVDWDELRAEVYALAKESDSIPDLSPALTHLLEALGDEHGRFIYNNRQIAFYNGPQRIT